MLTIKETLFGDSEISFRMSTSRDEGAIRKLIGFRFGNRDRHNACDDLDGRYLLGINEVGAVIAMTGLSDSKAYNGLEVDWTCVDESYGGRGLITYMLAVLLKSVDKDVYCSCWRLEGRAINMRRPMKELGFMPVIIGRCKCNSRYNNCRDICVNYNPIDDACTCYEDLYVRRSR